MRKLGGSAVKTADDLRWLVDSKQPGDSVVLTVNRNGVPKTFDVRLGSRPAG